MLESRSKCNVGVNYFNIRRKSFGREHLVQMSWVKNVLDLLKEQSTGQSMCFQWWDKRERVRDLDRWWNWCPSFLSNDLKGCQWFSEGSKFMWASCGLGSLAEGTEIQVLDFQVSQWGHSPYFFPLGPLNGFSTFFFNSWHFPVAPGPLTHIFLLRCLTLQLEGFS